MILGYSTSVSPVSNKSHLSIIVCLFFKFKLVLNLVMILMNFEYLNKMPTQAYQFA